MLFEYFDFYVCGIALLQEQFEIILQFCTGVVDISETYCDSFKVISARYLASPSGFGFDCLTSLPWSFNDFYAYRVTISLLFIPQKPGSIHWIAVLWYLAFSLIFKNSQSHMKVWSLLIFLDCFQSCLDHKGPRSLNSEARVLRIFKILRILKIIRILKAVKMIE